jgi:hypothetical protein
MMSKEDATEMREYGLKAVENLTLLHYRAKDCCPSEIYERLRRGIGLSIGRIQVEVLDVIYHEYPELDDLS